jgi:hypothetical protein
MLQFYRSTYYQAVSLAKRVWDLGADAQIKLAPDDQTRRPPTIIALEPARL